MRATLFVAAAFLPSCALLAAIYGLTEHRHPTAHLGTVSSRVVMPAPPGLLIGRDCNMMYATNPPSYPPGCVGARNLQP